MNLLHSFLGWLLEEKRLLLAPSWHAGAYHGRRTPDCYTADPSSAPPLTPPHPNSQADPRCIALARRQREAREVLRLRGTGPRVPISSAWPHDERAYRFARRFNG